MRWKWPRSTKSIWTPWPAADSSTRVILQVILHSSFFQVLLFVGFRDVYIFTSMSFNILLLLHQLNAQLRQSSVCPLRMTLALDLLRFFGHPPPPQFDLLSHTFHADISLLCPLNKLQNYFILFILRRYADDDVLLALLVVCLWVVIAALLTRMPLKKEIWDLSGTFWAKEWFSK